MLLDGTKLKEGLALLKSVNAPNPINSEHLMLRIVKKANHDFVFFFLTNGIFAWFSYKLPIIFVEGDENKTQSFDIAIDFEKLSKIVPIDGQSVRLSLQEKDLLIGFDMSIYKLPFISVEKTTLGGIDPLFTKTASGNRFTIRSETLNWLFNFVEHGKITRSYLAGIRLSLLKNALTVATMDDHGLTLCTASDEYEADDFDIVIPNEAIKLMKNLPAGEYTATCDSKLFSLKSPSMVLNIKTSYIQMPEFRKVIPQGEINGSLVCDSAELSKALRSISSVLTKERSLISINSHSEELKQYGLWTDSEEGIGVEVLEAIEMYGLIDWTLNINRILTALPAYKGIVQLHTKASAPKILIISSLENEDAFDIRTIVNTYRQDIYDTTIKGIVQ